MWATQQERMDLVTMFLAHGADANFDFAGADCRVALVLAVEKKNRELVEILVQKTNRVLCTRALGLAVDREDVAIAGLLLANGTSCNFEDSGQPSGQEPKGCLLGNTSKPSEPLTPPLARATDKGNVELVRLLLAHDADPNAAFHEISQLLRGFDNEYARPGIKCGRVVQ